MSNLNSYSEDVDESAAVSLRSASFIAATIGGVAAFLFDAYLIWRYWGKAPDYVMLVSLAIGVQLVYQWFRVKLSLAKVQELTLPSANQGTDIGPALQHAVRSMNEVLLVSYGLVLMALCLIGALLGKLSHG